MKASANLVFLLCALVRGSHGLSMHLRKILEASLCSPNCLCWDAIASDGDGSYSCGSRIAWLETNQDLSREQAQIKVKQEFESVCSCSGDINPVDPPPCDACDLNWVVSKNWDFGEDSSGARRSFLLDFEFDTKDYNRGNAAYQADPSLIVAEGDQLVFKVGHQQSTGCAQGRGCVPSIKVKGNFTMNPNTIAVFRASSIPHVNPSWPAFWSYARKGPGWPTNGEMDLFESVNNQPGARTALHSPPGCVTDSVVNGHRRVHTNCNEGNAYIGCGIVHSNPASSKAGTFVSYWHVDSANREGWYRTYWWPYEDLSVYNTGGPLSASPKPSTWYSQMYGDFQFNDQDCSVDTFKYQGLVINTNFCGEWSGGVYPGGQSACSDAIENGAVDPNDPATMWKFDNIKIWKAEPPSSLCSPSCPCWNALASDGDGSYSCGSRITWLETTKGLSRDEAQGRVKQEFESICACETSSDVATSQPTINPTRNPTDNPTHSPTPSPTDNPTRHPTNTPTLTPTPARPPSSLCSPSCPCWNALASDGDGSYSCGSRITWLETTTGLSRDEAQSRVKQEFESICACEN